MRRPLIAAVALTVTSLAMLPLAATSGSAQQIPLPHLQPPPPAPIKPYKPVAVTPPAPLNDPSFVAFRKQVADAAAHKNRAALAKLVVPQNFFWVQDKDLADPHKSGIDNLAMAIDLDAKDGSGWDVLTGFANEPTAAESPQQKGVFCGPADPIIDPTAFEALGAATGTDPSEWGFPLKDGVEVHASGAANAPVIDKLGMNLVRVLPDSGQGDSDQAYLLHVAAPSGKDGYVDAQAVSPLGGDQMCYSKDAGNWKIAGYFGGAQQQ